MIVRGIVEDVFKNQAKVRIPIFDQVYEASLGVEFNSLSDATICVPPKFKMNLKKGDLVFITFEDNDRYKPIIVGYIYNEENSACSSEMLDLIVNNSVNLSENTSIGEVTGENIKNLSGIEKNIQETINIENNNIENNNNNILIIENNIKNINNKVFNNNIIVNNINDNIKYINSLIGNTNDNIMSNTLFGRINFAKNHLNNILDKLGNVNFDVPLKDVIDDYSKKIKTLEESIHNGKTFNNSLNPQDFTFVSNVEFSNIDFNFVSDKNVGKYSSLYECIMTNSTCYRKTGKMKPIGVLWHDTGCDNNTIKRYVQPSKNDPNYNKLLDLIGKNRNGNDWNSIEHDAGVNAWIGKLADGSVATVQALPWDYRPWGCGSGQYGSCNSGWIQFEICEDDKTNSTYFSAAYKEALKLTAYLCKRFNINPLGTVSFNGVTVPTIICHWDSYKFGLGSSHYDVYEWFPKFGKCKDLSMNDVRNDLVNLLKQDNKPNYSFNSENLS